MTEVAPQVLIITTVINRHSLPDDVIAERLSATLRELGCELIPHERGLTPASVARALGCGADDVGKLRLIG